MASELWRVRAVTRADTGRITTLLRHAAWTHYHADWRLPGDWIGEPGFVLAEPAGGGSLAGCLCVAPDPPPAAWVRLAAIRDDGGFDLLREMLAAALAAARADGVQEAALLGRDERLDAWLPALGFSVVNQVITFVNDELEAPAAMRAPAAGVPVRDVRLNDLPRLVAIEEAAFHPIWRHSREGLALGWQHALSFHVAELDGRVAGFQYSTRSERPGAAHLVRLTVAPEAQRRGVGSALLAAALESYRAQHYHTVSLNTQADNTASRRLYERFGFYLAGFAVPVWQRDIATSDFPAKPDV
ncbi:MAG: GNAT family N-acetyltransferase [Anaerolineae bacterium]|nr:GNAT family N-acetyltransferase [Anaerolineae bacterium]